MSYTFKLRRGLSAEWTADNPVLAAGEPGVETDTGKFKIGDGNTVWSTLPYFVPEGQSQQIQLTGGTQQPTEDTQGPFYLQIVS